MYGDSDVVRRHAGRLREQGADLRALARHDVAAVSLETHGAEVDGLKDAIGDIERRSRALVADGVIEGFEAPAPGHRDWLSVTLPRHSVET
jgi:hypothetical protein